MSAKPKKASPKQAPAKVAKKPAPKKAQPIIKKVVPKKSPAKKVVPTRARPIAKKVPTKTTPIAKKPVAVKRVTPKRPKAPTTPRIWLHWCQRDDFDRMLNFYVQELMLTPSYIAHPELRAGVLSDPAKWRQPLLAAAIATLQEGFSPQRNTQSALLLRETGKNKQPEILAMFRVEVSAQRRALLLDLLVASCHRRKGYGRTLFQGVMEQLQKLGVAEVSLAAAYGNEESNGFFLKMGLQAYSVQWAREVPPAPVVEPHVVSRQNVSGFGG